MVSKNGGGRGPMMQLQHRSSPYNSVKPVAADLTTATSLSFSSTPPPPPPSSSSSTSFSNSTHPTVLKEGGTATAYTQLMYSTSQIPDSHSYVDFNLPTPPANEDTNSNHSNGFLRRASRGGRGNKQRNKFIQQQSTNKEPPRTQMAEMNAAAVTGPRRSKVRPSRTTANGCPTALPYIRQHPNNHRVRPATMAMMGGNGGMLHVLRNGGNVVLSPSPTPSPQAPLMPPHPRYIPGHCRFPLPPRHQHPRFQHPGRIGPRPSMRPIPRHLVGPGMPFMGGHHRGPMPPLRTPLPPTSMQQQQPSPPSPLVPFMNGVQSVQLQVKRRLGKNKNTIKTLKTLMNQYPIEKPWVTECIRREYEKKVALEERLKGNKDDDLFAQFKVQRDKFVAVYELARAEYLKKEADEIKAKVQIPKRENSEKNS